MDTIPNPHVWICVNNGDFINGTDKDLEHNTGEHGSCVMPFLKEMSLHYPKFKFVGVKHASAGQKVRDVFNEEGHRNHVERLIKTLRQKTILGGVLMNYGCTEALYGDTKYFIPDYVKLVCWIRLISGNEKLPIIIGRFEALSDTNAWNPKSHFTNLTTIYIECVSEIMPNTILAPVKNVPSEYYCNNHCYSEDGYRLWAEDAVSLYQENNFDSWNGR